MLWRSFKYYFKINREFRQYKSFEELLRASYDSNLAGDAAPYTDYVSKEEVKVMLNKFKSIEIDIQNFKDNFFVSRKLFLKNIAHIVGLDLYIKAVK